MNYNRNPYLSVDGFAPKYLARPTTPAEFKAPGLGLWQRRRIDHSRRAASLAIDASEGKLRVATGVLDVFSVQEPAPHGRHGRSLEGRCTPQTKKVPAVPYPPKDDKISQRPSRIALVLAAEWRFAALTPLFAGARSDIKSSPSSPICNKAGATKAFVVKKRARTKAPGGHGPEKPMLKAEGRHESLIFHPPSNHNSDGMVCLLPAMVGGASKLAVV